MRIFLLSLLLPLGIIAQPVKKIKPAAKAAVKKMVLKATITGLAENSTVSLISSDGQSTSYAKAVVRKGKFTLSGQVPETNVYLIQFSSDGQVVPVFAGNETITITGNVQNLDGLKFTGSPTQDAFTEYNNLLQPLLMENNNISQQAGRGGVTDSLRAAYAANVKAILGTADEFLTKNPGSPVTALMLLVVKRYASSAEYLETQYDRLTASAKNSYYGQMIGKAISEAKSGPNPVGAVAPDFSQADTTGKPVSLSSFKGKYVLLDFWASWCRPCRDENPNVVQNYNRFKDKNFTVLGVSLDRAKEPWIQAIADDNLTWTHVSDLKFWSNAVAQMYKINSIPQNLLIGPDGKIVAKDLRGPALEATLCKFLGCN